MEAKFWSLEITWRGKCLLWSKNETAYWQAENGDNRLTAPTTVVCQVISSAAYRLVYPLIFHIPFSLSIVSLFLGTLPQIRIPLTPPFGSCSLPRRLPPQISSLCLFVKLWTVQWLHCLLHHVEVWVFQHFACCWILSLYQHCIVHLCGNVSLWNSTGELSKMSLILVLHLKLQPCFTENVSAQPSMCSTLRLRPNI